MRWMLLTVGMLFSAMAFAQTKVAVVDMERALFLSNAAQASIAQFEKDNTSDINKLKSLEQSLRDLREKIEKDADIMSDDEARRLRNRFEEQSAEFQFFARKLQQMEQQWKRDFFQTQLPNIERLLKAIIDEGGYDVVLQSGAVIYSAPSIDLTRSLLERLNAK